MGTARARGHVGGGRTLPVHANQAGLPQTLPFASCVHNATLAPWTGRSTDNGVEARHLLLRLLLVAVRRAGRRRCNELGLDASAHIGRVCREDAPTGATCGAATGIALVALGTMVARGRRDALTRAAIIVEKSAASGCGTISKRRERGTCERGRASLQQLFENSLCASDLSSTSISVWTEGRTLTVRNQEETSRPSEKDVQVGTGERQSGRCDIFTASRFRTLPEGRWGWRKEKAPPCQDHVALKFRSDGEVREAIGGMRLFRPEIMPEWSPARRGFCCNFSNLNQAS